VRRLALALLLLLTCAVAAGVVYVIGHDPRIPNAGKTPGFTPSLPTPTPSGLSPSRQQTSPSSTDPSSSTGSAQATTKITFLGDDYTVGRGAKSRSKSWTELLAKRLDVAVTAVGESDAGYAKKSPAGKTYSALVAQVAASAPDLVVVSGGRNDVGDDPNTLRSAAHGLFAKLHHKLPHARLIAIAPWWGDSPHPQALTAVDDAVRSGVRAAGGEYLDTSDPLTGHPAFMYDVADPNDKGYRAIADSVAAAIQAQLPR
jgi:lysophospholipase L1-like esterase